MNKQDWIDYFEAVNGRSPEAHELEAALAAGEFVDETASAQEAPVNAEAASKQEQAVQEPTNQQAQAGDQQAQFSPKGAEYQQAQFSQNGSVPLGQLQQQLGQDQPGQQPHFQFQQGPVNQGQQVYNMQVAVPSPFVEFLKQFWTWLLAAIKAPTLDSKTHKYNGLAAYGLLVILTSLTVAIPLIKLESMTFSAFISILIAFAFIFFAFILGGFVVKRVVYKEARFTFSYSFEWFGRLFSLNIVLMAIAALSVLINLNSLALITTFISYFIFLSASAYSLYHPANHSQLDLFYKYILASLLFSVILIVFMMLGATIAGEMLFNGILENFSGPFGY